MNLIPVRSSAIAAVGYDPSTQRMKIRFTKGVQIYTYCRVPEHVYEAFMSAHSMGQFYKSQIDGRYDC